MATIWWQLRPINTQVNCAGLTFLPHQLLSFLPQPERPDLSPATLPSTLISDATA